MVNVVQGGSAVLDVAVVERQCIPSGRYKMWQLAENGGLPEKTSFCIDFQAISQWVDLL